MTKLTESEVEAAMRARALRPDPWTYEEMCRVEAAVMLLVRGIADGRIADKIQQRWRRKGWATFSRIGRDTFWALTPAGRAALHHEGGDHGRS